MPGTAQGCLEPGLMGISQSCLLKCTHNSIDDDEEEGEADEEGEGGEEEEEELFNEMGRQNL